MTTSTDVCGWCDEEIAPGERSPASCQPMHIECLFRAVCGSLAHQQHRCSCYVPGSTEGNPEGMTRREAAAAALAYRVEQEEAEEHMQERMRRRRRGALAPRPCRPHS
jgi:hypothetical protein